MLLGSLQTTALGLTLEETDELVQDFVHAGLVTKVELQGHEVHVEPILWHTKPVDDKRTVGELFSWYFHYYSQDDSDDDRICYILNRYSGTKLAEYSSETGLKIYWVKRKWGRIINEEPEKNKTLNLDPRPQ